MSHTHWGNQSNIDICLIVKKFTQCWTSRPHNDTYTISWLALASLWWKLSLLSDSEPAGQPQPGPRTQRCLLWCGRGQWEAGTRGLRQPGGRAVMWPGSRPRVGRRPVQTPAPASGGSNSNLSGECFEVFSRMRPRNMSPVIQSKPEILKKPTHKQWNHCHE